MDSRGMTSRDSNAKIFMIFIFRHNMLQSFALEYQHDICILYF